MIFRAALWHLRMIKSSVVPIIIATSSFLMIVFTGAGVKNTLASSNKKNPLIRFSAGEYGTLNRRAIAFRGPCVSFTPSSTLAFSLIRGRASGNSNREWKKYREQDLQNKQITLKEIFFGPGSSGYWILRRGLVILAVSTRHIQRVALYENKKQLHKE